MNTVVKLDTITHQLLADLREHAFGARVYAGTITREEYAAFLAQTYHYVLHTRPLLARASERLASQGKMHLALLFRLKAEEESGHELWVLEDLRAIGEGAEVVQRVAPTAAVQSFVAWNSYVVEHGSPLALLGAAYVLEAVSATHAGIVAANLVKHSGIRGIERGVRFLRGHADADVDHIATLGQAIEALASSDQDRVDIVTTARIARWSYTALYTALGTQFEGTQTRGHLTSASEIAPQALPAR